MESRLTGRVFVLGDDVDTDQIIPAKNLVYSLDKADERVKYGENAFSGVPLADSGLPQGQTPFTGPDQDENPFSIVVAGKNFGCGSSREHAPAALQIAGVKAIVASSYARIFYRNAVDGGFVLPIEAVESLVPAFHTGDLAVIDLKSRQIYNKRTGAGFAVRGLGQVEEIIAAGGIFAYARQAGLIGGRNG